MSQSDDDTQSEVKELQLRLKNKERLEVSQSHLPTFLQYCPHTSKLSVERPYISLFSVYMFTSTSTSTSVCAKFMSIFFLPVSMDSSLKCYEMQRLPNDFSYTIYRVLSFFPFFFSAVTSHMHVSQCLLVSDSGHGSAACEDDANTIICPFVSTNSADSPLDSVSFTMMQRVSSPVVHKSLDSPLAWPFLRRETVQLCFDVRSHISHSKKLFFDLRVLCFASTFLLDILSSCCVTGFGLFFLQIVC